MDELAVFFCDNCEAVFDDPSDGYCPFCHSQEVLEVSTDEADELEQEVVFEPEVLLLDKTQGVVDKTVVCTTPEEVELYFGKVTVH